MFYKLLLKYWTRFEFITNIKYNNIVVYYFILYQYLKQTNIFINHEKYYTNIKSVV